MSNNANLIASLKYVTTQINRYGPIVVIFFGTVGNLLNFYILNDRAIRTNPCTTYMWWSSILSILFIWSGLLTRMLDGYGIDWPNQNPPLCKIRLFLLNICWSVATWSFVGAGIDRYLCSCTSASLRSKSTVRIAKRYLLAVLIVSILLFVQVFYCYEASVPNVPVACNTRALACQLYNDWMNIMYDIVIPSVCMAVFGIFTILNIRKRIAPQILRAHVTTISNRIDAQPRLKKIDYNLRTVLFIQISILLVLNLPIGVQRFYSSITSTISKSSLRTAIENLIYAVIVLIRFIPYSVSFYIYMLTGSIFRAAFRRIFRRQVHPDHTA